MDTPYRGHCQKNLVVDQPLRGGKQAVHHAWFQPGELPTSRPADPSMKSAASRRGVAIDPDPVAMLRAHRGHQLLYQMELGQVCQDHGLVFPGPSGGPLDPSVLTRNFEKTASKAGFPGVRLHDLRHGHAAGLIRSGAHAQVVQERLGHASAAFTMQVSGHVSPGFQGEAAVAFANTMAGTGC